jgi:hypothetical protein
MKRFALMALLSGCWVQELADANKTFEPGGKVSAQLSSATRSRVTSAIARGKAEPLKIEGASSELTFVLVAAGDTPGGTVRNELDTSGGAVEISLADSRNKLEVHLEGTGCLANAGSVRLRAGDKLVVSGDFAVTGTLPSSNIACAVEGTLADVPQER